MLVSILTNITCISRSATNPDVILRQKPSFSHPFLQKVLSLVAFNPQSRPALDAHFPDAFDPIRLKTLAFVCTMMDFQAEEPEEFENHLMIMLADSKINLGNAEKVIRKKKQTAGLSGDALKK
ncbi:hypothetical protein M422DRAFT_248172 [Sphaerobolus stellatus SS14]|uniref:DUF6532 domain-containing protein n=1 Tax=Sphaerobolus stellatus (strain SS14) TaxID=990650 RepID=A0A0C9W600_SPHS4|nr:hypothetical protein M422DRAFT_248172 [Sphaerobolus stellatus SS14]